MQEQQVYDQEVAQVQAWFQSERFKHVKRPYTAKEGMPVELWNDENKEI